MKHIKTWVFYGRSATGKTTLACTLPKPLLLVDINDEGTDSVANVDDVFVMEPKTWEELDDLYWALYDNPKPYKTVVIDTITQVQQLIVEELGSGKGGKNPGEWGTLTKQDWGNVASRMKEWITRMKTLPIQVVFIAQERVFNTDDDEMMDDQIDPEIGPRLSPSVMDHLCASVSVIGNTFIREKVETKKIGGKKRQKITRDHCLRLGPNPVYITKIRRPKENPVPDFIEDPTYKKIKAIIEGDT